MPKPADDALLTCKVVPTPNALEQELKAARHYVGNGAVLWNVNISEYSERLMARDGPPDPYIEADFTIRQVGDALAIASWSIRGTEIISTRKSRIPLQTFARAALVAVEGALQGERTYKQMAAQGGGHVVFLEMSNGRLLDPETQEQQKPSPRHHAPATNGKKPTLELEEVVAEYRKAIKLGSRSPTADTAAALNVGRSTAARALAAAREQGLLGPPLRNRAGERLGSEP